MHFLLVSNWNLITPELYLFRVSEKSFLQPLVCGVEHVASLFLCGSVALVDVGGAFRDRRESEVFSPALVTDSTRFSRPLDFKSIESNKLLKSTLGNASIRVINHTKRV